MNFYHLQDCITPFQYFTKNSLYEKVCEVYYMHFLDNKEHHLLEESLSGGQRDLGLHAVGHVSKEGRPIRALVPHPDVVEEGQDPLLHARGEVLLSHVVLGK